MFERIPILIAYDFARPRRAAPWICICLFFAKQWTKSAQCRLLRPNLFRKKGEAQCTVGNVLLSVYLYKLFSQRIVREQITTIFSFFLVFIFSIEYVSVGRVNNRVAQWFSIPTIDELAAIRTLHESVNLRSFIVIQLSK